MKVYFYFLLNLEAQFSSVSLKKYYDNNIREQSKMTNVICIHPSCCLEKQHMCHLRKKKNKIRKQSERSKKNRKKSCISFLNLIQVRQVLH